MRNNRAPKEGDLVRINISDGEHCAGNSLRKFNGVATRVETVDYKYSGFVYTLEGIDTGEPHYTPYLFCEDWIEKVEPTRRFLWAPNFAKLSD